MKKKSIVKPLIFVIIGIALLAFLYLPFKPCQNAVGKISENINIIADSSSADELAASGSATEKSDVGNAALMLALLGGGSVVGVGSAIGGGVVAGKNAKKNKADK